MTQTIETETALYQDAGVLITPDRFAVRGHTVSMRGVTSVGTVKVAASPMEKAAIVFGLIILVAVGSAFGKVLGLAILAFGVYGLLRPTYALLLTSASGEQRVLADRDKARVLAIAEAVNRAMTYRG